MLTEGDFLISYARLVTPYDHFKIGFDFHQFRGKQEPKPLIFSGGPAFRINLVLNKEQIDLCNRTHKEKQITSRKQDEEKGRELRERI